MTRGTSEFQDFLAFSAAVTGYPTFRLAGTGNAELFYSTVRDIVGHSATTELVQAFQKARQEAGADAAAMDTLLRRYVMSDEKLGPVARNVIKLWYVGTWYQMPAEWREAFGADEKDRTFVPAPGAYTEGLLWPTIGANPSGAKGPGYGTWAEPPRITVKLT